MQKRSRSRKNINRIQRSYNRRTALWLVLLFPVGITRMLSSRCSWKPAVKYAITGLVACALVAVMFVPSPYNPGHGGIELYGEDREVEIFGPALPETIVEGYTTPVIHSGVLSEEEASAAGDVLYVYAAEEQQNYHMPTCKFAYASGMELTLYEAYYLGYIPGRCCDAPAYTGP